jgi:hypothetical protein
MPPRALPLPACSLLLIGLLLTLAFDPDAAELRVMLKGEEEEFDELAPLCIDLGCGGATGEIKAHCEIESACCCSNVFGAAGRFVVLNVVDLEPASGADRHSEATTAARAMVWKRSKELDRVIVFRIIR